MAESDCRPRAAVLCGLPDAARRGSRVVVVVRLLLVAKREGVRCGHASLEEIEPEVRRAVPSLVAAH